MDEDRFDKIEKKVDEIQEDIYDLKVEILPRLDVYNEQLKTHIKSSQANSQRLKHVEDHVIGVKGFFKGLKIVFWIASGVAGVLALWKMIM